MCVHKQRTEGDESLMDQALPDSVAMTELHDDAERLSRRNPRGIGPSEWEAEAARGRRERNRLIGWRRCRLDPRRTVREETPNRNLDST